VLAETGRELSMGDIPSVRLLRGESPDPLLMRTVHRASGALSWKLLKATPLTDEDGAMLATVTIIEDVTASKAAELRSRFLAEAGEMLASSLDYGQTLQNVAWSVVPRLADWCAVDLVDESGVRDHVVVAHADPERLALSERLREYEHPRFDPERDLGGVLATGRPAVHNEISDEQLVATARDDEHLTLLRQMAMRSVLLVPLRTPSRTLGAMTLVLPTGRRRARDRGRRRLL